jgi:hypothetical protein
MFEQTRNSLRGRDPARPGRRAWPAVMLVAIIASVSAFANAPQSEAPQDAKADEQKPVVVKHGGPRPTAKGSGGFLHRLRRRGPDVPFRRALAHGRLERHV